jgi:hypothetical protein
MLRTVVLEDASNNSHFIQVVLNSTATRVNVIKCDDENATTTLYANRQIGHKGRESLPRLTICKTSSGRVLCGVEISHVLVDATSMAILRRDLARSYDQSLPAGSGFMYDNHITYLHNQPSDHAVGYWKTYLEGCEPCHFPQLQDASFSGGHTAELQSVDICSKYISDLHAFCNRTGLTVSNVLQVAWGLVLRAFSGLDTVCFGYLVSCRDAPVPGIEEAVGPFINMMACRLDFTGPRTVPQILEKAQTDFLRGLASQHCVLSDVLHSLNLGHKSIFNTCMTFPPEGQQNDGEGKTIHLDEIDSYMPDEVSYQ